uniref:Uncharacterized protein n=1 Tax=Glossina pallidipes TaxID=7398 RepID=A0A1A9ZG03_GLOPL
MNLRHVYWLSFRLREFLLFLLLAVLLNNALTYGTLSLRIGHDLMMICSEIIAKTIQCNAICNKPELTKKQIFFLRTHNSTIITNLMCTSAPSTPFMLGKVISPSTSLFVSLLAPSQAQKLV